MNTLDSVCKCSDIRVYCLCDYVIFFYINIKVSSGVNARMESSFLLSEMYLQ